MHVVIADPLPGEIASSLEALGYRVTLSHDSDLASSVKDADVLVVARSRVTRLVIAAAPRLKAIVRAGVGVEAIDVAAASERGIIVGHCPDADVHARAEHVLGLVLALDRKAGSKLPALGLRGRTLGLVGFDAAARAVHVVATALGMRVLVYDPALTPALAAEAGVHRADTIDMLFGRAEVVSLHTADTGAGAIVTRERLGRLPAGATLVNVSARGLIDLEAAKDALAAGQLRLALDVYDANDYGDDVPFAADAYPGLLVTHRQAGKTRECDEAVAHAVVRALEVFLVDRVLPDAANLGGAASAGAGKRSGHQLVVRHNADPGVLPGIFEALQEQSATIAGVDGRGFEGGGAGLLRVALTLPAQPALIDEIAGLAGVLGVEAH